MDTVDNMNNSRLNYLNLLVDLKGFGSKTPYFIFVFFDNVRAIVKKLRFSTNPRCKLLIIYEELDSTGIRLWMNG